MMVTCDTIEATDQLGVRLGSLLKGGEVIELVGDIGAGKTTLTKAIAIGMGVNETVQSPTFTISQTYLSQSGLRLSHYDFYRLSDAGIMRDELAETMQKNDTVTVIEWGDVVRSVLPKDYLEIRLSPISESSRAITFHAYGNTMTEKIKELAI